MLTSLRLDVNGNSTDDLPAQWPIPTFIPARPSLTHISLPFISQQISATWRRMYPHQSEFLDVFDDTARFSIHLSSEEQRTSGHIYNDVVFAGNLIIALL